MKTQRNEYDAVVVGAGPNGLAAAITLAGAGKSVLLIEAAEKIGGGIRSEQLTLPGFIHDPCATILSLTQLSPFFRSLNLNVEWVIPSAPLAHPLDDGTAILLERSLDATAANLGRDARAWRWLFNPFVAHWDKLALELLGPLRVPPRYPLVLAWFGLHAIRSARGIAHTYFKHTRARALFGGLAAHALQPLENSPTAAFGIFLGMAAHVTGWSLARGGSQKFADALAADLRSRGGEIVVNTRVESLDDLPRARAYLCNVNPRALVSLAGKRLNPGYARALEKYRYGPGVFKIDWALDAPIPWRAPECLRAGTVHLGGAFDEIAESERAMWRGHHSEQPFVLLAQPTLFDPTRAPQGKHTAWAYCHVPNGSTFDMTARIENQVERFAPGFRDHILARHTFTAAEMQAHNANYLGGDIAVGIQDLAQQFARPVARLDPYSTGTRGIYICSSATPPGGGAHGMSGYYAAQSALREMQRTSIHDFQSAIKKLT